MKQTLLTAIAGISLMLLSSCYLFVGSPADVLPLPDEVRVLELPTIVDCNATAVRTVCQDRFETACGWYFWTEPGVQTPATGWIYACPRVWRGTDCWFDITIHLTVLDPSNDLSPSKSPRVRVLDSEPASGSTAFGNCFLNVSRTDIAITSTDVVGNASTKTVSVRLQDVLARFTAECRSFSAKLRFAIVFEVDGEELSSPSACETLVECRRP